MRIAISLFFLIFASTKTNRNISRRFCSHRSDEDSDYEFSDRDISKLLIVTQVPSHGGGVPGGTRITKHEGHDRTGEWASRVKISQEIEQAINDGLYYYEKDLWTERNNRVS